MHISNRQAFGGLAAASLGLLVSALTLGEWLRLQPCYWCNFQRLVYLLLCAVGLCGVLLPNRAKSLSVLSGVVSLGGVYGAAKQSWMQYAPQEAVECGFGFISCIGAQSHARKHRGASTRGPWRGQHRNACCFQPLPPIEKEGFGRHFPSISCAGGSEFHQSLAHLFILTLLDIA